MNETATREELISPSLKEAGWGVVEGSRIRYELFISNKRSKRKRETSYKADYVLEYKNRNLAVIEAKARSKSYTEGASQAKLYAQKLDLRFAFSTNGEKIYCMDLQKGEEYDIDSWPSPEELWDMVVKEEDEFDKIASEWRDVFLSVPFEDKGGRWQPRYYQEIAINKALEAIAKGQERILLTLATGTGKTAIAFQIVWKLFKSKWSLLQGKVSPCETRRSPRVLFLADRNILADQAYNAFSAFDEDALVRIRPEIIRKEGSVPTNGSIFFTIFQTLMSGSAFGHVRNTVEEYDMLLAADDGFGDYNYEKYPKDFFDLIIIDECHRGGANDESNWRGLMEYFSPAVQIGLTATPKRKINADTYEYFGEPVYIYSLKDGINDGFLTPFRVKQILTNIDEYIYHPDDIVLEGEIDKRKVYSEQVTSKR